MADVSRKWGTEGYPIAINDPLEIERVPMRGAYSRAGEYFGLGAPVFRVDDANGQVFHVRARNIAGARRKLSELYHGVRFRMPSGRLRSVGPHRSTTKKKPTKKARKWTGKVTKRARWHPRPGLFQRGSSMEIATYLAQHSRGLQQAMSRLTFYENRAGKNLTAERRRTLENAKDHLRLMY